MVERIREREIAFAGNRKREDFLTQRQTLDELFVCGGTNNERFTTSRISWLVRWGRDGGGWDVRRNLKSRRVVTPLVEALYNGQIVREMEKFAGMPRKIHASSMEYLMAGSC